MGTDVVQVAQMWDPDFNVWDRRYIDIEIEIDIEIDIDIEIEIDRYRYRNI
jgi:hypothetical protein